MLDQYTRVARVYPALICLIPIQVLFYTAFTRELSDLVGTITGQTLLNVGVGCVLLYLLTQVNRFCGKEFELLLFQDESLMPTTELLMPSNQTLSSNMRTLVGEKLHQEHGLTLPTIKDESENEAEARRRIVDAISLIRRETGRGKLLWQHNQEYGFARNLVGGAPLSLVVSMAGTWYCLEQELTPAALLLSVCGVFFLLVLIMSKLLLQRYGQYYAKRLIQEFV